MIYSGTMWNEIIIVGDSQCNYFVTSKFSPTFSSFSNFSLLLHKVHLDWGNIWFNAGSLRLNGILREDTFAVGWISSHH